MFSLHLVFLMMLYLAANHVFGWKRYSNYFLVVLFSYRKGTFEVKALEKIDLDQFEEWRDRQAHSLKEKCLLSVSVLESYQILTRAVEVPLVRGGELLQSLAFHLEPFLPYPIEEAVLSPIFLKTEGGKGLFSVLTTSRSFVLRHLEELKTLSIQPGVVSCTSAALASFSCLLPKYTGERVVVLLDEEESVVILVEEQKLIASRLIAIGGLELSQRREETILKWKMELRKALFSLSGNPVTEVTLVGESTTNPLIVDKLQEDFEVNFLLPPDNEKFKLSSIQLQSYALPLGLGLSATSLVASQVNFLPGIGLRDVFNFLKKKVAVYFFLVSALSVTIFLGGKFYLSKREDALKKSLQQLVFLQGITLSKAEELDPTQLMNLLSSLETKKSFSYPYPLLPQVPRVGDFLAWFSSLPLVQDREVRVEKFHYSFVKQPDKKRPKDPYLVKVELEFKIASPQKARELHEFFLKSSEMINVQRDFVWTVSAEIYRTSFILNDKTLYL